MSIAFFNDVVQYFLMYSWEKLPWWKMQFIISGKDNSDLANWYMLCSVPRSHRFRDAVKWRLYLPTFSAEKEMATHSSTLAWKIPWTEEPVRLQSMGSKRVFTFTFNTGSVYSIICQRRDHHMGNYTAVCDCFLSCENMRKIPFSQDSLAIEPDDNHTPVTRRQGLNKQLFHYN